MNHKSIIPIIFIIVLAKVQIARETDGTRLVRQRFGEGRFCMDENDYPTVASDKYAAKLYVDKICSQVPANQVSTYISTNFGSKVKVMGQGSFGKVLKYKKGDNLYAIKIPTNFDYTDVFKEINGSECIKHFLKDEPEIKNIAYIYECVRPPGKSPHLIMKFLPFTLEKYVKAQYPNGWAYLDSAKKEKMLKQMYIISKTLLALHKKNLAHRDLKPANIMVSSNGTPFLVDFGTSSPMGDLARTLVGTPYYVDYEVMNRNSKGLFSDVYSLLMVFVAMLHGKRDGSVLNAILRSGGYDQVSKGLKKDYTPTYSSAQIPEELNWMKNMFIPSRQGRWTVQQVVQKFEMLLNIPKVPQFVQQKSAERVEPQEIRPKSQMQQEQKRDVSSQQRPKQDISEAMNMVNKVQQQMNQLDVPKQPARQIPTEKAKMPQQILAISEEPSHQKQINMNKDFNDGKFANPYLHANYNPLREKKEPAQMIEQRPAQMIQQRDPNELKNKYMEVNKKTPITEMKEVSADRNYYGLGNVQRNPALHYLDKDRQANFQKRQAELDAQINQMLREREIQKKDVMVTRVVFKGRQPNRRKVNYSKPPKVNNEKMKFLI